MSILEERHSESAASRRRRRDNRRRSERTLSSGSRRFDARRLGVLCIRRGLLGRHHVRVRSPVLDPGVSYGRLGTYTPAGTLPVGSAGAVVVGRLRDEDEGVTTTASPLSSVVVTARVEEVVTTPPGRTEVVVVSTSVTSSRGVVVVDVLRAEVEVVVTSSSTAVVLAPGAIASLMSARRLQNHLQCLGRDYPISVRSDLLNDSRAALVCQKGPSATRTIITVTVRVWANATASRVSAMKRWRRRVILCDGVGGGGGRDEE